MCRPKGNPIFASQHGQASVFVLAMLGVVLLVTVFLYQSGRLTSEKMQIQNGADSAAFGASVLEARSLNFAAYTNRAMVANEVAIGQLVGLLSFADELKTSRKYAGVYATFLTWVAGLFPPAAEILIPLAEGIETVGNVLGTVGDTLGGIFKKVMPPFIKVISLINRVYSTSQKIYQGVTYALIFSTIDKSLQDNIVVADGGKGPVLTPFGFLAVVGHIPSSWSGLTRIYSAEDDKKNEGIQRLAATVRAGRDPFSSGCKDQKENPDCSKNRDWYFTQDRNFNIVKFTYGADSAGGSELRATEENKSYSWTAADGLVFGATLKLHYTIGIPKTHLHTTIKKTWNRNIPFGTGGYRAVVSKEDIPLPWPTNSAPLAPEAYGGAVNKAHSSAWPGVMTEMGVNALEKYDGLHSYRDSNEDYKPLLPISAPFFLVGVTKPLKELKKQGPQFSDHFDLHGKVDDEVGDSVCAIAKSELYFAKPPNEKKKKPERKEKPNSFSPYWQARLVDTSNSERLFALAVQQDTLWLTENEKSLIPKSISSEFQNIIGELNLLVGELQKAIDWL